VHRLPETDGQNLYLNEKGKNQIVCLAPLLATGAFLLPLARHEIGFCRHLVRGHSCESRNPNF